MTMDPKEVARELGLARASCDRVNCDSDGEWSPTLLLYHDNYPEPVQVSPGLTLCGAHAHGLEVVDVIDDVGWDYIMKNAFDERKLSRPKRELTRLVISRR